MKLFNLFKRPSNDLQTFEFVQAGGFRGFKRYPVVVYGDKESEANNERLKDVDMRGKLITFKLVDDRSSGKPFLLVFVDGKKVGAIFDDAQVNAMTSGSIESVYAKFDAENVVDSGDIITRHRVRLFVKYR